MGVMVSSAVMPIGAMHLRGRVDVGPVKTIHLHGARMHETTD
jgi:hypothetical protein